MLKDEHRWRFEGEDAPGTDSREAPHPLALFGALLCLPACVPPGHTMCNGA